jgi:dienelactone hydrolase
MQTDDNENYIFKPEEPTAGFIFYPGGKVEYTAYIPLMKQLASEGVMGVLVKMPFNLAVFDIDAAEGIQEQYPEIEKWYIGGHSLGGSMAAAYLEEHTDAFDGLILLGSYSTTDLTSTDLDVLSIYGSEDRVLNAEKYEEYKVNLPEEFVEIVIDGGCHAYFGAYGMQEGDGEPGITCEEQTDITVKNITEFINK